MIERLGGIYLDKRKQVLVRCKDRESALKAYRETLSDFNEYGISDILIQRITLPVIKIRTIIGLDFLFSYCELDLCGFSEDLEIFYDR